MKTKRVFLFTAHFPYGRGEVFIENEIGFLADAFEEVWVIPLLESHCFQQRTLPDGVKLCGPLVHCTENEKIKLLFKGVINTSPFLRIAIQEFIQKKVWKKKQWLRNWISGLTLARAGYASGHLKSLLGQIRAQDIIYFYWADSAAYMLPMIRKKFKNFACARFHNTDLYEENKGNYLPFRNYLLPQLDLGVFIANNGLEYVNNRYPGQLKESIVSKLGVFDRGLSLPSDGQTLQLVSCSSIVDQKRVHLIPEALKTISFPVHWIHFGDGPLRSLVETSIQNLPYNIKVSLMGHVNNSEVLKYYKDNPIDLFINVSKNEGIPVSIMEASSMGIPTMATEVGGVAEIVNGENGVLLDPNITPIELADKISWFYHLAPQSEMRKTARNLWQDSFNAERNYPAFCKLLSGFNENKLLRTSLSQR
jgi:colanic acid/amylovoran biosynthesis glycosyltransferase